MYYPYFRAKQYELKALREFSEEHQGQNRILPIIEPVRQDVSTLTTAINDFSENALKFALILNPGDGDFKHFTSKFDTGEMIGLLRSKDSKWIPAFLYSRLGKDSIERTISKYGLKDVMIVFRNGIDADDEKASELTGNENVRYVVCDFNKTSRRMKGRLREAGREVIRLDNCFVSKQRNVEYAYKVDEFFSDAPFYFREDGYQGYSDYTTLPDEYIEGGMLPYALVIHLSYLKNKEELYVHHFVSDSNITNSDVRRKFYEAAQKVEPFYEERDRTKAVDEIISRARNAENGYPGLGYLKKLSIKNHLELILSLPEE